MSSSRDPVVAAAGRAVAEKLRSGKWTDDLDDFIHLFADLPSVEGLLRADAQLIAAAGDRDRAEHDVAQMWELRMTGALSRKPELTTTVAKLAATHSQHNTPGEGGAVFANQ
ncbi:hypothetical protein ALI144C_48700 [Actinosynnema sp. ALI-1.44]|uniref:hypothetical protein n=1 Tax=Actinosynnema sp. ALI-1.44 TaxID=1933779 RepID=UPI00097C05B3|nr:hypothetical protein [Actinosynnema sp. ALI-1.44]ONI70524.1 hypothetical protein ALI144C_48700 [Actinosynnema sp. ALI-1.44]